MKKTTSFLILAGLLAMAFVFSASKCESNLTFPGAVAEICNDKIDNDSDGQVDCADAECAAQCQVNVTINPPGSIVNDTLPISGTATNANSVSLIVRTTGSADQAVLNGNTWSSMLRQLSGPGPFTVTATATGIQGSDTAMVVLYK